MALLLQGPSRTLLRRIHARSRQSFHQSSEQRRTPVSAKKNVDKKELNIAALQEDAAESNTSSPATKVPLLQRLGPLTRVANSYDRVQNRRPWATQVCASLCIYFCGDMLAQYIDGEEYDPMRTLRHLTIGAGASIPGYTWFMFLNRHFNYPSALLSLATKVVVNQIVFAPTFNSYFFAMQSLLAGASFGEMWARIKHTVPTSMYNSCKLWPAVTAFSFTYIAPRYRFLFAGGVAVGWQSYLSWLNQRAMEVERVLSNNTAGPIDG